VPGVEEAGESEGHSAIERIGPASEQEIPDPKGCLLPAGLDGKEVHGASLSLGMLDDEDIH
jgi:hypothetical protein